MSFVTFLSVSGVVLRACSAWSARRTLSMLDFCSSWLLLWPLPNEVAPSINFRASFLVDSACRRMAAMIWLIAFGAEPDVPLSLLSVVEDLVK